MEDFEAVVEAVAGQPDIQVVVVRGAGRAFSAGSDLDMQDGSAAPKLLEFFERHERTRDRVQALEAEMLPLLRACLDAPEVWGLPRSGKTAAPSVPAGAKHAVTIETGRAGTGVDAR